MLISLILPIFNMENKLHLCMESIFGQQGADLEIILVDDGSNDKTPVICDKFGQMDSRVVVIHQENQGLSAARNKGISVAKGEYLWFIDPDDTITENSLKKLVEIANKCNCDIIKGNHWRINQSKGEYLHNHSWNEGFADKYGNEDEKERFCMLMTDWTFGNAWAGFYRRQFVINANIYFENTKEIFLEDVLFNSKLWAYRPRCYLIDFPIYNYYDNPNSLLNRFDEKRSKKLLNLLINYYEFLKVHNELDYNLDLMVMLLAKYLCWMGFETAKFNSLESTINCIKMYGEDPKIRELIKDKDIIPEIKKLNRFEDRVLYRHSLSLLIKRKYRMMATEFYLLNPLLDLYEKKFSRD